MSLAAQAGIGALTSAVTGLPELIEARRQAKRDMEDAKRDRKRSQGDLTLANKALADIKAGKLEFEPEKYKFSQRETDAYEMAMGRGAEDAAAQAREQAMASMAGGGDARMRQAVAGDVFGQQARQDALAGLQSRQAATSALAGLESSYAAANRDAYQEQKQAEIKAATDLKTGSRRDMRVAKDRFTDAKRDKKDALREYGMGILEGAAKAPLAQLGANAGDADSLKAFLGMGGKSSTSDLLSTLNAAPAVGTGVTPSGGSGLGSMYGGVEQKLMDGTFDPMIDEDGGRHSNSKVAKALEAARRFKTGGEFSHETNKKAVIDEESGVKEAEFTGEEEVIVFNPEQKTNIDQFIKDGDEKGLFKFLKKLFKEPQFAK